MRQLANHKAIPRVQGELPSVAAEVLPAQSNYIRHDGSLQTQGLGTGEVKASQAESFLFISSLSKERDRQVADKLEPFINSVSCVFFSI